jgi:NDP-sugar pyrophosphorylase family protein
MITVHREKKAAATVGLYTRDVTIDLGVVETNESGQVIRYIEKPAFHYDVSMGIYVFEPRVLDHIPKKQHFDLPDLIRSLIEAQESVVGYKHTGYWLDIGRPDDYRRAQEDFPLMRERILNPGQKLSSNLT